MTFWEKHQDKFVELPWSGCWVWIAASQRKDYGAVYHEGRVRPAHIISWCEANGRKVPKGRVVRHTCDVKSCINPAHLLIGTQHDNLEDARERGTMAIGEKVGTSVLTSDEVAGIRFLYRSVPISQQALGRLYGVEQTTIGLIVRGVRWQHVATKEPILTDDLRARLIAEMEAAK